MHSFWFIKGGAPMSGKQQGLRYFQKFLNSKASERNALAKKVLRCVLAVGFALSPWLGGEAYAGTAEAPGIVRVDGTGLTDTKFLDGTSNVAHIYAEQASGLQVPRQLCGPLR